MDIIKKKIILLRWNFDFFFYLVLVEFPLQTQSFFDGHKISCWIDLTNYLLFEYNKIPL